MDCMNHACEGGSWEGVGVGCVECLGKGGFVCKGVYWKGEIEGCNYEGELPLLVSEKLHFFIHYLYPMIPPGYNNI